MSPRRGSRFDIDHHTLSIESVSLNSDGVGEDLVESGSLNGRTRVDRRVKSSRGAQGGRWASVAVFQGREFLRGGDR